jgi:phosphoglycerate kinase
MTNFPSYESVDVSGKHVLVRMDLNVPMEGSKVRDMTRINRHLPTLKSLIERGAKVVLLSHFGRPDGKADTAFSLSVLVDPISEALGKPIQFAKDCIGAEAEKVISNLQKGEVALLENLRFHFGEKKNDPAFAKALAANGDLFVNDAFSCAHRAHASVVGITDHLPAYAGGCMIEELSMLSSIFDEPERPLGAVVGGAKVSTKLSVLHYLVQKVDKLIIGGAMAHSFLVAQGYSVGKSLYEPDLVETAREILEQGEKNDCEIILPTDVVVTKNFSAHSANQTVPVSEISDDLMALDVGLESTDRMRTAIRECRSLIWNGPLGAFEMAPFDMGTVALAREAATQTSKGKLHSVAGGGDTVAALAHSGITDSFTYISTAGGAFLEWMEGKELPGVAALTAKAQAA